MKFLSSSNYYALAILLGIASVAPLHASSFTEGLSFSHATGSFVITSTLEPKSSADEAGSARNRKSLEKRWERLVGLVIRNLNEELGFYGYEPDSNGYVTVKQKVDFKKIHFTYKITEPTLDIPNIERTLRHLARMKRSVSSAGIIRFHLISRQQSVPYVFPY